MPAITSAIFPSCLALWASIGLPNTSPITNIFFSLVRCCLSTLTSPYRQLISDHCYICTEATAQH
jgi:hypothetical protein